MELTPPTGAEVMTQPRSVQALRVRCLHCGARPGQPCQDPAREIGDVYLESTDRDTPHRTRVVTAQVVR